jgi:hypothetical protein
MYRKSKRLISLCIGISMCNGLSVLGQTTEGDAEVLHIVFKPSKTTVHLQEYVPVQLRVENASKEPQHIYVMSCSWFRHWKTSDPLKIYVCPWACSKNFPEEVVLAPGEAYTKDLKMEAFSESNARTLSAAEERTIEHQWESHPTLVAMLPSDTGTLSFKVGFTPLDGTTSLRPLNSSHTYWSEDVQIAVVP